MRVNRGLVFWGVALITAGAVALAIQSGSLPEETARQAWRLWPLLLIVIGLAVIAGRTPLALAATVAAGMVAGGLAGTLVGGLPGGVGLGCGGEVDEVVTEQGSFAAAADVTLDLNCGELLVSTTAGDEWTVEAGYAGDGRPRIEADDGSLRVEHEGDGGSFIFGNVAQEWNVTLPTRVAITLEINANAAAAELDLAGGNLRGLSLNANAGSVEMDLSGADATDLEVEANAGSVAITTDADTRVSGSLSMNAGSLELCVPDGVSLSITLDDNLTFSHNLDDQGLSRDGDTWSSGSGEGIRIEVEGNAGSFTLNPTGGCR